MTETQKNTVLDKPTLRKFGLVMGMAISLLFGLALPLLKSRSIPVWPWAVAALFWLMAALLPLALASFYKLWMKLGLVLGKVNSRIILGIFFFLIITPVALFLRLFRRQLLDLGFDAKTSTYRKTSATAMDQQRFQNPY